MEQGYSSELPASTILDHAEQQIFEIAQSRNTRDMAKLKDVLADNMALINELADKKGDIIGVPTGFIDLDKMTSGMQKSDLIILAARPSMGKTAFALCVARNAAIKIQGRYLLARNGQDAALPETAVHGGGRRFPPAANWPAR